MVCFLRQLSISLIIVPLTSLSADPVGEAKTWYMNQYAPLWTNPSDADPEKVKNFWVDGFRDHPADAESVIFDNSVDQWQRNIDRYKAQGWRGGELVDVQVEKINEQSVIIRSRWKDYGIDGLSSYCDCFIAGKFHGDWKFTNYFTIECPDL